MRGQNEQKRGWFSKVRVDVLKHHSTMKSGPKFGNGMSKSNILSDFQCCLPVKDRFYVTESAFVEEQFLGCWYGKR